MTCYHQDSKRHLSSLPRLEGLDHMMKEITEDTEEDRKSPEEDGASQGELTISLGLLQLLAGSLWCICFKEQWWSCMQAVSEQAAASAADFWLSIVSRLDLACSVVGAGGHVSSWPVGSCTGRVYGAKCSRSVSMHPLKYRGYLLYLNTSTNQQIVSGWWDIYLKYDCYGALDTEVRGFQAC